MSRSKILAGLLALSLAPSFSLFAQPTPAPKAEPRPRPDGETRIVVGPEGLDIGDCRGAGFSVGKRPYLGVEAARLTSELRRHFGASEAEGVLVSRLIDGGPAARAGIEVGDVIVRCAGAAVTEPSDLRSAVKGKAGGESIAVELFRGGQRRQLNVRLDEKESCVFDLGQVIDPEDLRQLDSLRGLKIDLKDLKELDKLDKLKDFKDLEKLRDLGIDVGSLDLDGLVRNAVSIAVAGLDQALQSQDWQQHLEDIQQGKAEELERRMEEVSRQLEILERKLESESGRYGEQAKREVERARADLRRELERSKAEIAENVRKAREEAQRQAEEGRRKAEKAARDAARSGSGGSGGEFI